MYKNVTTLLENIFLNAPDQQPKKPAVGRLQGNLFVNSFMRRSLSESARVVCAR